MVQRRRFSAKVREPSDAGYVAIVYKANKSLDVHVNTVRYRLSRVEPLFVIDLDDPETLLLVWLQLWARRN